jgi:hypothetical protein
MIDRMTKEPIRVTAPENARPSIRLPKDQVVDVSELLDANGIGYWVGHISVSVDGQPYVSRIHLRQGADPNRVQALLDAVP